MGSFEFLKDDYKELYQLCSDAEKYIKTDASASMLKIRQALEWIIGYLGFPTDDLFASIKELGKVNPYIGKRYPYIDSDIDSDIESDSRKSILDEFHTVRMKTSYGIHTGKGDCISCLNSLKNICDWFFSENYRKFNRKMDNSKNYHEDTEDFSKKFSEYFSEKYNEYFSEKYSDYIHDELAKNINTYNPLKVMGVFAKEEEVFDPLQQDEFETWEDYCARIESLPPIRVGYVIFDKSQVDKFIDVVFPLFNISKNPLIEDTPIAALFVPNNTDFDDLDGYLKAKIKVYDNLFYYDYDSLTVDDNDGNEIKLTAISWDRFGYEDVADFLKRIRKLPLLPIGIARPIREKYDLKKQILPFEIIPMAYVSELIFEKMVNCSLNRDVAKEVCSIKSNFIVYANFDETLMPFNIRFYNVNGDEILIFDTKGEVERKNKKSEVQLKRLFISAKQGNADAQYLLANHYENGNGINKDESKALEWYKKAAEQGNANAQYSLGNYYYKRMNEEKRSSKSFDLAEVLYYNGSIPDDNQQLAIKWYQKASEQGHIEAKAKLEKLMQ